MRILKGTILLVSSVYLSVSRLASRVWFHPVVWNPLCFAEIVYG